MSRVGKQIITIPEKTDVVLNDGVLTVKGPLGELRRSFKSDIAISIENGQVTLKPVRASSELNPLWGTYASHIVNMIAGVNKPYEKKLILEGVGYRVEVKGKQLAMQLGFSHPVTMDIPEGLTVTAEKGNVTITGSDKELVGQFSAALRDQKKPEPYKGKGFRYADEVIRRKEGKRAA